MNVSVAAVEERIGGASARVAELRAELVANDQAQEAARRIALGGSSSSFETTRDLADERAALVAELESSEADLLELARQRDEAADVERASDREEARRLAVEIDERKLRTLTKVGKHVRGLADAYAELVENAAERQALRNTYGASFGDDATGRSEALTDPLSKLGSNFGGFLHQLGQATTYDVRRGKLAPDVLIDALPEVSTDERPSFHGVDPYTV